MLAEKLKAEIDAQAPKVQAARKKFADAKKAAQDNVPVEKLLDVNSDEFKQLDDVHREYTSAAEKFEQTKAAYAKAVEMDAAGSVEQLAESFRDDAAGTAERLRAAGYGAGMIEAAAKRVASSDDYKQLVESGVLHGQAGIGGKKTIAKNATSRSEFKALLTGASDTEGGALVTPDRQGGIVGLPVRQLTILDLITVGRTDSDLVEFVRQTARPTGAAFVPEATTLTAGAAYELARKPKSNLALEVVTTAVKTVAHWIPATRRALADAGQLRTLIEQGLEYGLNEEVEDQVLNGDGTGEDLLGIYNTGDIVEYVRGLHGAGGADDETRLDALHKTLTLVRLQNIEPTAFGMHPNDWQDVRLEKDANGQYMLGPANAQVADTVWGLPVAKTAAFTEGLPICANWGLGAALWLREGVSFYVTDSNRDWFELNILAILAEMRVAFGVQQPRAFAVCDLDGASGTGFETLVA